MMQRVRAWRDKAFLDAVTRVDLAPSPLIQITFPVILAVEMALPKRSEVEFAGENLPVDRDTARERSRVPRGVRVLDEGGLGVTEAVKR